MHGLKRVTAYLLLLGWIAVGQATGAQRERLALVIGNAAYKNETPLENTLNDARDLAARLRAFGFEVTEVQNAGRRQLARSTNAFLRQVQSGDAVALFYYAGHGLQVNGQNYLVPVDARIEDELDVRTEGLALNQVLGGMGGRGAKAVNLVILDACRNNPFKKQGNRAIGERGLARVEAPESTLILYATRPGDTASDNPGGDNGLFTKHLLAAMDQPGVRVEEVFRRVAANVYQESGGAQYPWPEGLTFQPFYFVPARPDAPGAVRMPPGSVPVPPPPPAPPVAKGYLQVVVNVDDARVMVNGKEVGRASARSPLNLSSGLPVGLVQVLVSASGRESQARTETIQANRWTQAVFRLSGAPAPLPPPQPPPPDPAAIEQRLGLNGQARKQVQEALNALGHPVGAVDGDWGRNTRTGIEAWQRGAGREATGYLTAEGYKALLGQAEPVLAAQRERELAQRVAREREAAQARAEAERKAREQAARRGLEPEMVAIRGGSFQMGSPSSEKGRDSDERQHRVHVDSFEMGKYEVTVKEFRRFVEATGYRTDAERNAEGNQGCWAESSPGSGKWGWQAGRSWRGPGFRQGDDHPVACVSWNDAEAYVAWLNRETGGGYRLPTEAQWEYAARGGNDKARFWGDDPNQACRYANVADRTAKKSYSGWTVHDCDDGVLYTAKVGSYRPNPWGLHDMLGNVWEWTCSDWDEGYGGGEQRCSSGGAHRAGRGGSWRDNPRYVRSADRSRSTPGIRNINLGFRLARTK